MSLLTSLTIVIAATFITTWFNDKISKAEYLNDENV